MKWKLFSENKSEGLPGGDGCSFGDCILYLFFGIIYFAFFLISSIFYLLFFIWADIFNYYCGSKRKINYFSVGKFENYIKTNKDNIILEDKVEVIKNGNKEDSEIWKFAYSIKKWNSESPWICYQCKYANETFERFIPQYQINLNEDNQNTSVNILNESNLDNGIISILFNSVDGRINYSVSCRKKDLFYKVVEKLFIQYPEYKDKKYYFIQNANVIDLNKDSEENKITSGQPIIMNFIDE